MTNFDTCIAQITTWGRANVSPRTGVATDTGGHFSKVFTEYVRRELRSQAIEDETGTITGSFKNGYTLHLDTGEAVGLGKGYKRGFCVFYRPARNN